MRRHSHLKTSGAGATPVGHLLKKLLSHRVRGFGAPEHSPAAFRAAVRHGPALLEIDTRASADGDLFVHHDPLTGRALSERVRLAHTPSAELRQVRYESGDPLLRLEEALALFATRADPAQRLCLDIKDYGFEEEHLRLVRQAGVEEHVSFVSWIPQSLVRLRELGTSAPLLLSHTNLLQFPLLAMMTRPWRRSVRRFGRFVLLGHDRVHDALVELTHGFQHSLVCDRLPGVLVDALAGSGGGVCLHHRLAGARVERFCRQHGLQLWVFTARTPRQFTALASRTHVDVVFADDAPALQRALQP